MKKESMAAACLFLAAGLYAQNSFHIKGKIERLSKSHSVTVAGAHQYSAAIQEDGSFEINGEVTEPAMALIFTDSSGADGIWLEPGNYSIACKEITMEGIPGYLFRTPGFTGPRDATISNGFFQPRYYLKGASPAESIQKNKIFAGNYIDSIFKYYPGSGVLPDLIHLSQGYLGDEATGLYLQSLSPGQQNESTAKMLAFYFKRKEKMAKEKYFEDFTMNTVDGKEFRLSKVTRKKLILIDFWSSDCFPCRQKHQNLVALYEKYAGKGLEIVSVSLDDNKKDWLKAIEKDKMVWVNVSELTGWDGTLASDYFVKSLPYSLWLDGDRKIIGDYLSPKEISGYLDAAFNPSSPGTVHY